MKKHHNENGTKENELDLKNRTYLKQILGSSFVDEFQISADFRVANLSKTTAELE